MGKEKAPLIAACFDGRAAIGDAIGIRSDAATSYVVVPFAILKSYHTQAFFSIKSTK